MQIVKQNYTNQTKKYTTVNQIYKHHAVRMMYFRQISL
jgi:hypothetical protein